MACHQCPNANIWCFVLGPFMAIASFAPNPSFAKETKVDGLKLKVIDGCWRWNSDWRRNRKELALCSEEISYVYSQVTDPSDNALESKPGTLRYGATMIRGKKWITFQRDMCIRLEKPLLISVHLIHQFSSDSKFYYLYFVKGPQTYEILASPLVMGPNGKIMPLGQVDGDAIRLVTASKVWIDHNTLYECQDGLLDVTRGSTDITVSNNWFRDQDKVMLLGHDDGYFRDKNMRVTVVYNHFGTNCNQRMPSSNAMHRSLGGRTALETMNPGSFTDIFENGASFVETGAGRAKPNYNGEQTFPVVNAKSVRSLARSSGALKCIKRSRC
ncbi:hypothetical protein ACE6H2_018689 [Prunus campanulata]